MGSCCKTPTLFIERANISAHNGWHLCLNIFPHLAASSWLVSMVAKVIIISLNIQRDERPSSRDGRNWVALMCHWFPFDFTPPGRSAANHRRCSRCTNRPPYTYRTNCASSWGRCRLDEKGARMEGVTYVIDASSQSRRQRREISETRNWGARIQWARSSVKRGNIGGEPMSTVWDGDLRSRRRPLTMTHEPIGNIWAVRSIVALTH